METFPKLVTLTTLTLSMSAMAIFRNKSSEQRYWKLMAIKEYNRDDRIRTCDILLPKQARYQAALHPVVEKTIQTAFPEL